MPGSLFLKRAERSQLTLSVNDSFDRCSAKRSDQLVLQVCVADVETESLQVVASEVGTEACPLEAATEVTLFARVAEARELDVSSIRAEPVQKVPDCLRAADRHDRDSFGVEVATASFRQRLERDLVADSFDQYDRPSDQVSVTTIFAWAPSACRSHASATCSSGYVSMSKAISPAAA